MYNSCCILFSEINQLIDYNLGKSLRVETANPGQAVQTPQRYKNINDISYTFHYKIPVTLAPEIARFSGLAKRFH
jgi:hypothetical protein